MTSSIRRGLAVGAFVALASAALPAASSAGGIAGIVTRPGGAPLGGIEVSAYVDSGTRWTVAGWTNTGSDGGYRIDGLPDGSYRLLFLDRGQVWAYQYFGGSFTLSGAADVTVSGGTTTVDMMLEPAGHIQGVLTDAAGDPLEYPLVFVHTFEDEPQLLFLATPNPTTGAYDLGGLPTGQFIVQFTGRRGGDSWSGYYDGVSWIGDATPVPVVIGETTTGIDGILGPPPGGYPGGVDGLVSGPGGLPLPSIEVSLYRRQGADWVLASWQNTGSDGRYAFGETPDGTYTLLFRDWSQTFAFSYLGGASRLADAAPFEIAGAVVTVDASLEPAGRIAGTLTDPGGTPLDNALVFVHTAGPESQVLFLTSPDETTGGYDVGGLPTGEYLVQFSGWQDLSSYVSWYDDADSIADATAVPVTLGETTSGIDGELGLPPGGVIEGVITDPYDRAFDFARVSAFTWDGSQWVLSGSAETTFYEPDYRLQLAPGSYRLRFEAGSFLQPDLPAAEYFDNALDIDSATDVAVELDGLTELDVIVGDLSTGSISGTVTDADSSAPLAGIEVYPADRRGRVLWDQVAVTDSSGGYTIEGLWPEAYFIELFDPDFVYETLRLSEHVVVGEGAVTGVDAALEQALPGTLPGTISGTITAPDGGPLFNVQVVAQSLSDGGASGFAATDSTGRYRVRGLPADQYRLRFAAPDGFRVTEWYDDVSHPDDATPVTLGDGVDTAGVDAELAPAGAISGSITNRFGGSFFISTATTYSFDGTEWRQVATTASVSEPGYRLEAVPVGTVRVLLTGRSTAGQALFEYYDDVETIEAGTDVPVVFGEVTRGIDAVLGSAPPGAISGTVTDGASSGLGGIEIRVYDDELELAAQSVSEIDGSYTVGGLYDGRFYVEFVDPSGVYPSEAYDDVASVDLGTPVFVVDGGTTAGIDAALDGSGSGPGGGGFRGTVTDAVAGGPVGGIRVRCIAEDFSYVPGCSTTTEPDGTYQLAGFLPGGLYFVQFRSTDGMWADEWYDDVAALEDATPVAATPGGWTDGLDAAVEPAGGISGTVTSEGGGEFPLLVVTAYGWNGSAWEPYATSITAYDTAYEVLGLPEGSYRLRFRGGSIFNPDNAIVEYYDDVATLEQGTDVPVTAGVVVTGIDAVLGNINGTDASLVDPGFDGGIEAWTLELPAGATIHHGQLDVQASSDSGSAEMLAQSGAGQRFGLSQCVAVAAERRYEVGGWLRVGGAAAGDPTARASVEFFAEPGCGGTPLASETTPSLSGGHGWAMVAGAVGAPPGSASARVHFIIDAGQAASFDANWDDLFFRQQAVTFADGFEAGGLDNWSTAVSGR